MKVVRVTIPFKDEHLVKIPSGGNSVSIVLPEECKRVVSLELNTMYSEWQITYEA